jgi:hypothetical protein
MYDITYASGGKMNNFLPEAKKTPGEIASEQI